MNSRPRVLIADYNIFTETGGGQTAYRTLIKHNPGIDFFYLRKNSNFEPILPSHVKYIDYQRIYRLTSIANFSTSELLESRMAIEAANIGASVHNLEFDWVDVPDYRCYGTFLRSALESHSVKCNQVVLALHGLMSTTWQLNWPGRSSGEELIQGLRKLENSIFQSSDLRYSLSARYANERRSQSGHLPVEVLSPFYFFEPYPLAETFEKNNGKIYLNFIGRHEKRKGPDLFLDIVWSLKSNQYGGARIIGSESYSWDGISSEHYLSALASNRLPELEFIPSQDREKLLKFFKERSITILPSRYDSFNLLAVESLLAGTPTVIGSGAGVCDFLRSVFPTIPFVEVNPQNIENCLLQIENILNHYDDYRSQLIAAVKNLNIHEIYSQLHGQFQEKISQANIHKDSKAADWSARRYWEVINSYFCSQSIYYQGGTDFEEMVPTTSLTTIKKIKKNAFIQINPFSLAFIMHFLKTIGLWGQLRHWGLQLLREKIFSDYPNFLAELFKLRKIGSYYEAANHLSEFNQYATENKVKYYWRILNTFKFGRSKTYRELSRLETILGHLMNACAYGLRNLRIHRVLDPPHYSKEIQEELASILSKLNQVGLKKEAEVAQIMYGKESGDRSQLELNYLQNQKLNFMKLKTEKKSETIGKDDFEIFEQHLKGNTPEVSIIVSLYNAEAKLPLFFQEITKQSLFDQHKLELVFVDSFSTTQEYQVYQKLIKNSRIPSVYARTPQRETIQTAWNRGIGLSHGKYLSFLGVDETLKPNACEILLQALQNDHTIDWVMANSLITDVDMQGQWKNDVMMYDRTGYHHRMHYLECCYLSYVGGMYKKNIHERFGYYDGSFKAAGDTEFKNRVLPFIRTKNVQGVLGKFLNYPDDRTTASALAELEDLRAWYLHRTLGGVRYAFQNTIGTQELEEQFWMSLYYRKSYSRTMSTDLEYGLNLLRLILEREPHHRLSPCFKDIHNLLKISRSFDAPAHFNVHKTIIEGMKKFFQIKQIEKRINKLSPNGKIHFELLNDNRYEQHSWIWNF